MTRRQSVLLYSFSIWTLWVWGTRIWNTVGDDERSTSFKVVHIILAVVSVAFAVTAAVVVRRVRRVHRVTR